MTIYCQNCGAQWSTERKGDYQEIVVCPQCGGAQLPHAEEVTSFGVELCARYIH